MGCRARGIHAPRAAASLEEPPAAPARRPGSTSRDPGPSPRFGPSQGQGQQHRAEAAAADSCGGAALSPGGPRALTARVDLLLPDKPCGPRFSVDSPELSLCLSPSPRPRTWPTAVTTAPRLPGVHSPKQLGQGRMPGLGGEEIQAGSGARHVAPGHSWCPAWKPVGDQMRQGPCAQSEAHPPGRPHRAQPCPPLAPTRGCHGHGGPATL